MILAVVFHTAASGAGEVDTAFNASAFSATGGVINTLAVQPDGKILIGGAFTVVNGRAYFGLARLNPDGTPDTAFNPPDFIPYFNGSSTTARINAIAFQSSGKILVGGLFRASNGTYRSLIRLNTDGSLDTTFNDNSNEFNFSTEVLKIVVSPNDSIYIGGNNVSISAGTVASGGVVKLNSNGVFDQSYHQPTSGSTVKDFIVQPDGKVIEADVNIGRFNADGSLDNSFSIVPTNGSVKRLQPLPDGKFLAVGSFTQVNGFLVRRIARINPNGSVDLTFNTNGAGADGPQLPPVFAQVAVYDVSLASDGKILIGGSFSSYNGTASSRVARLNADGTLDTSFTYTAQDYSSIVYEVEALPGGKVLIGGDLKPINQYASAVYDSVQRLNMDGSVDASFPNGKIGRTGRVREILQQPDGKILIVGDFPLVNNVQRNGIARLNADGTLDTTFVPFFNGSGALQLNAVALQPDGKILAGATNGIRRMNPDGSSDPSFVTTGQGVWGGSIIYDVVVLQSGKILIGGYSLSPASGIGSDRRVMRLNPNGTVDNTFDAIGLAGGQTFRAVYKVHELPDGKYLVAGDFTEIGGVGRGRIARLNTDGSLDTTFNPPGGANGTVFDFEIQPDGKIVLVGSFTALNGNSSMQKVGRLNPDGSLDTSFAQQVDGILYGVKLQPDGKILIAGIYSTVGGQSRLNLARLNPNGSLDPGFNAQADQVVVDVNLQSDGKILIGGDFTRVNGFSRVGVARLLNNTAPVRKLFDYDGDGKADVSVFRPSENKWYILRSSDGAVTQQIFAVSGDVPVPADYDGDGKTDITVYRPASADWWTLSSQNGNQNYAHWGQANVIARPSDFDGDGKSDYIFFLPANSTWYRYGSQVGASYVQFGLAGDKPVTGDFDGDGKSDVAIFRPSTGDWWWQSSIDNIQRATHWGISTDIPAPADYDGDGKTDFAVYRASSGVWYIYNSSNNTQTIFQFGINEDKPVPADYDGDGKADIAVFRPSTGVWYLQRSTAGFTALQFGASTDIPTENAFVP